MKIALDTYLFILLLCIRIRMYLGNNVNT